MIDILAMSDSPRAGFPVRSPSDSMSQKPRRGFALNELSGNSPGKQDVDAAQKGCEADTQLEQLLSHGPVVVMTTKPGALPITVELSWLDPDGSFNHQRYPNDVCQGSKYGLRTDHA